jgi:photosystem II stability/assembly factor-like uncharacterized protein
VDHGLYPRLANGLTGWWDMETVDEQGHFIDLSGRNGAAVPQGKLEGISGKTGQALYFPGERHSGLRVETIPGLLELTRNFTISAWVRLEKSESMNRFLLAWPDTMQAPVRLLFTFQKGIQGQVKIGDQIYSTPAIPWDDRPELQTWSWVLLTRKDNVLNLFLDGSLVAQNQDLPDGFLDQPSSGPLLLGGDAPYFESSTLGGIDEVQFFNRFYPAANHYQIQDHHLDPDRDGLSNREEYLNDTDPNKADSDGDGLKDGLEVHLLGSNPMKRDSDGDALPDAWEYQWSTDILKPDADLDPDMDQLNNFQEFEAGTDPFHMDSDYDQLNDQEEINLTHTDPSLADTDFDGLPDPWEIANQGISDPDFNPLSTSLLQGHWTFDKSLTGPRFPSRIDGAADLVGYADWQPEITRGRIGSGLLLHDPWMGPVIPDHDAFLNREEWTILLWIAPDHFPSASDGASILDLGSDPSRLNFRLLPDGTLKASWVMEGSSISVQAQSIPAEEWTQVGLGFDGARLHIILNGSIAASSSKTTALPSPLEFKGALGGGPGVESLPGRMDDLRVYMAMLSSAQLRESTGAALEQTEWINTGPGGGGWMQAIASDPEQPGMLWAGGDISGLFVSEDGGEHWVSRSAGLLNLRVQDIRPDPLEPGSAWIATCGGLFHYSHSSGTNRFVDALPAEPISRIVIGQASDDDELHIYAALGIVRNLAAPVQAALAGSVYHSPDGGRSWSRASQIPGAANIQDLEVCPDRPERLVATSDTGVTISSDSGKTWSSLNGDLPHPDTAFALEVEWSAEQAPERIFITTAPVTGVNPVATAVFLSNDQGNHWETCMTGANLAAPLQGYAPLFANIQKVSSEPGTLFLSTRYSTDAVLVSHDYGETWSIILSANQADVAERGFLFASNNCHELDLESYPDIYAANWFQILKTQAPDFRWTDLASRRLPDPPKRFRTRGIENTVVDVIAVDPEDPDMMLLGNIDVGLLRSEDAGVTFAPVDIKGCSIFLLQDVFSVVQDPDDLDRWYLGYGAFERGVLGGIMVSRDGARSFSPLVSNMPNGWVKQILMLRGKNGPEKRIMYTITDHGGEGVNPENPGIRIYKSSNSGQTWTEITSNLGGLPSGASVIELKPDPENPDVNALAVVADAPGIIDSLNGVYRWTGTEWKPLYRSPGSSFNKERDPGKLASLLIDPENGDHWFAGSFGYGIYESRDAGHTWRRIYQNPAFHLTVLDMALIERSRPTLLAAVANQLILTQRHSKAQGVVALQETSEGDWVECDTTAINQSLPSKEVRVLLPDPHRPGRIYIGTTGNGMFFSAP